MRDLTAQENKVLDASKELWEQFLKLNESEQIWASHEDGQDFLFHINAIQNLIFARPAIQSQKK